MCQFTYLGGSRSCSGISGSSPPDAADEEALTFLVWTRDELELVEPEIKSEILGRVSSEAEKRI